MQTIDFHSDLKLAISEKEDGNIDDRFSDASVVKKNRKTILKKFGIKAYDLIEGQQIHFDRILPLNPENSQMWKGSNVTGVDGFIFNQPDIAIMLRVADCVPLVLYDEAHRAFGIFHVGWKGAVKNIHLTGLEKLTQFFASEPHSLRAWLGPSAGDCFISKEKPDQTTDPNWKPHIKKKQSAWTVDIPGYVVSTLNQAGVLKKNITVSSRCTVKDTNLFSHQRSTETGEKEGRFAVIVQLL